MANGNFQYPDFTWFMGKVVDVADPEKMGRVRVRIHGHHSPDQEKIKDEDLYWATVMMPVTEAATSGVGMSPTGLTVDGDVVGFFADGKAHSMPVIMGTLNGKPERKDDKNSPSSKKITYEKYDAKESDVNRLARNENIDKTIVKKKKDSLVKKVPIANSDKTWDELESKFEPEYPQNRVYETESGHVREYDDTKDKERIHEYHKAGSFYEISPDGSKVTKVVKDNYEIIAGDEFVYIKGKTSVTIDGTSFLLIKGDCSVEISGNKTENIKGNYALTVKGDYSLKVEGSQNSTTKGNEKRKASKILLN